MNSISIFILLCCAVCALCAGSVQIVHVHETNPEMYEEIVLGQQDPSETKHTTQTPSSQPDRGTLYLGLGDTSFYYVYIVGSIVVIACLFVWRVRSLFTQPQAVSRIKHPW